MKIFIEFDGDYYRLMCDDGRMSPAPCGARLFRARPHPDIQFEHLSMEMAEADAKKLRAYLDGLPARKVAKKKEKEGWA